MYECVELNLSKLKLICALRGLDILNGRFYQILMKWDSFQVFPRFPMNQALWENGSTLKGKNLFLFKHRLLAREAELVTFASPVSISIPLKIRVWQCVILLYVFFTNLFE